MEEGGSEPNVESFEPNVGSSEPNVGSSSQFRRRKSSRKAKKSFSMDAGGGYGLGEQDLISSNFPFRSITKLQEGKRHIFTTGKELTV